MRSEAVWVRLEVAAGCLDELPIRADAVEEHDQVQLEEDGRINGGTSAIGVALPCPVADAAQGQLRLQLAIDVVPGNELLK
jgi:hypothetical protein